MKSEKCFLNTLNCTFVRAFLLGSPGNVLIFIFSRNFHIAREEYSNIWNSRALGDKFLKFGMVLGKGIVFSKSIVRPLVTSRGQIQNDS